MQLFFIIIFFGSLFLVLHSYMLYPFVMRMLSFIKSKRIKINSDYSPPLSIIISAFNEEKVIEKTIRNFLKSDYDISKIEFVIGSDNSTDKTNQIISELQKEISNLKFFPFAIRRGKSHVLNDIVKEAASEILIFSDANTIYKPNALKELVKFYSDDRVGGVSGKLILLDDEKSKASGSQETTYWDAESWLKDQEGKLGCLIGANGGIYSLRKKYFKSIPTSHPVMDDFYISLMVLEQNKYFLYEKKALAEEITAPTLRAEFNRKIRNNSIMLSTIKSIKKLLNPKFGLIAFGLWSHKIIRWYTPVLLILLFVSNLFLVSNSLLLVFLIIQIAFYLLAVLGYFTKKIGLRIIPLLLCFYFVMTNIAMLIGIFRFFTNKQTAFWQSTPR